MVEINGMSFPLDRKYYSKDGAHLWLKEEDGIARIGMDAFGVDMAGLLTFLDVKKGMITAGESLGSFESAKFVSKIYSPATGEIVEINQDVISNPRKINDDPYDNWILSIRLDDVLEDEHILSDEEAVTHWMTAEFKRMEEE